VVAVQRAPGLGLMSGCSTAGGLAECCAGLGGDRLRLGVDSVTSRLEGWL
jgi:hypothetical protein